MRIDTLCLRTEEFHLPQNKLFRSSERQRCTALVLGLQRLLLKPRHKRKRRKVNRSNELRFDAKVLYFRLESNPSDVAVLVCDGTTVAVPSHSAGSPRWLASGAVEDTSTLYHMRTYSCKSENHNQSSEDIFKVRRFK